MKNMREKGLVCIFCLILIPCNFLKAQKTYINFNRAITTEDIQVRSSKYEKAVGISAWLLSVCVKGFQHYAEGI